MAESRSALRNRVVQDPVGAAREIDHLYDEVSRLSAENKALKGWAAVGQGGYCIHSKTVMDCAGCQIRVLRWALEYVRATLLSSDGGDGIDLERIELALASTREASDG